MNYKAYAFPAIISVLVVFYVFFKLGPEVKSTLKMGPVFSSKFDALPSRVAIGEITAAEAVSYASKSVPLYVRGTDKIISTINTLMYFNAIFIGICCFMSAYFAKKSAEEAQNSKS